MRVITFLTTYIVIVTSFAVHRHSNSVENDPLRHVFDELERQLDELPRLASKGNLTGDIALRVNSNGMSYLVQQLLSSVRHDVTRHAPTKIKTTYLGMELHIEPIQIVSFRQPTIHFENEGSVLRIVLKGGRADLLGQYSAKYKTNREGQLEATLDDIDAQVEIDLKEKRITTEEVSCSHLIGIADIKLTPILPSQISQLLKDEIIERVGAKVCPSLQNYVARTLKVVRRAVKFEEPLEEDEIRTLVPHRVLSSSISDKKAEIVFERKDGNHHDIIPPREGFSMASVTVSTDYINDFLRDLADKGDIIFHLDRIPAINQLLRLKCMDSEECLGFLSKLHGAVEGTAHLEAKAIVAPRLEVHNGTSKLKWKLLTVLSYQNLVMGRRVKYLQFHIDLVLNVADLRLEEGEQTGRYCWMANYTIDHLEMSRIATYFESIRPVAGMLPELMDNHRLELENLISDHLTANIPLMLNSHIRLSHEGTQFQEGQITFELNFKTDRKLSSKTGSERTSPRNKGEEISNIKDEFKEEGEEEQYQKGQIPGRNQEGQQRIGREQKERVQGGTPGSGVTARISPRKSGGQQPKGPVPGRKPMRATTDTMNPRRAAKKRSRRKDEPNGKRQRGNDERLDDKVERKKQLQRVGRVQEGRSRRAVAEGMNSIWKAEEYETKAE